MTGLVVAPSQDEEFGGVVAYWSWMQEFDPRQVRQDEARAVLRRYRSNARLVLDERGKAVIDSAGARHQLPAEVTQLVWRTAAVHHVTRVSAHTARNPWLMFCDADGQPLFSVAAYGWEAGDLERFASEAGWDLDLAGTEIPDAEWMRLYPRFYSTPRLYLSGRLAEPRSIGSRLKSIFSRSGSSTGGPPAG